MGVNYLFIIWFSALSFLFYGCSYYLSSHMRDEFKRYGLEKFALMVSTLQILGGLGLIVGLQFYPALIISSGGLAILMLLGFMVRLKIKDGFWRSLPAFAYFLLNAYLFYSSLN